MTDQEPNYKETILGDDGIHKRRLRERVNKDGSKVQWAGQKKNAFWGHIETLMEECEETLISKGFPSVHEHVRYVLGHGWLGLSSKPEIDNEKDIAVLLEREDIPQQEQAESEKREEALAIWNKLGNPEWGYAFGDEYAAKAADVFSEEWYAGQIHILCRLINNNRESTYEGHLLRIYQIAEFEKDREWRHDFGSMVKRDIHGIKSRKRGGHERKKQTAPATMKVLMSMQKMIGKHITVSRAAELTAQKGIGTSKSANRQLWNRHKDRM